MSESQSDNPQADPPKVSADSAGRQEIAAVVEAVLVATDSPLSAAKIAELAQLPGQRAVKQAIADLNERYEQTGCTFRVEEIANGYQILTLPEYHDVVSRLHKSRSDSRLSQAAMETLAIVAYRQPILRADIEAIRGVACGDVLRGLIEKQLVKIVGRAEVLGRPMLYGTTRHFLKVFGLANLDDLPRVEELRSGATAGDEKTPAALQPSETDAPAEPAESDEPE